MTLHGNRLSRLRDGAASHQFGSRGRLVRRLACIGVRDRRCTRRGFGGRLDLASCLLKASHCLGPTAATCCTAHTNERDGAPGSLEHHPGGRLPGQSRLGRDLMRAGRVCARPFFARNRHIGQARRICDGIGPRLTEFRGANGSGAGIRFPRRWPPTLWSRLRVGHMVSMVTFRFPARRPCSRRPSPRSDECKF
jgi:hypothetical protein